MMSLHRFPRRFQRDLGGLVQNKQLNVSDLILRWNSGTPAGDRNLEASYAAAVPAELTVSAFIHWVSMRAIERGFTDFKAGDVIVTFEADVSLDDKRDLVFVFPDEQVYVQQSTGKTIVQFWDVFIGGEPLTRTLLLRLKP